MNDLDHFDVVFESSSARACREHALVLKTADIEHEIRSHAGRFLIVVPPLAAESAKSELDAYAKDNANPETLDHTLRRNRGDWIGVIVYAAVLSIVAALKGTHAIGVNWMECGMSHAGLICGGEGFRAVTALTLHADAPHLLANLIVGGLFGLFATQLFGPGVAWLTILIGGTTGNLVNALVRPFDHTSIGASTAVFAALGLMAAYAWTRRHQLQMRSLARWTPIIGGFVLLGYLGTGGPRTDVFSHVAGFGCGILLGLLHGSRKSDQPFGSRIQIASAILAVATIAVSWTIAIANR